MNKDFLLNSKRIKLSVALGLICAIMLSFANFNAACDELRTNVLRLHIIANSDSQEDQAVKLKVRDAILEKSQELFDTETDLETAIKTVSNQLSQFEEIANQTLAENGFSYEGKAEIADTYFETREYDDFTLPAGTYTSLVIRLGDGVGQNWWCVIFPGVCVPSASDASLSDSVSDKSASIAENKEGYVIKFKVVEIYENLKKLIKK